jgi:hypothetical protein
MWWKGTVLWSAIVIVLYRAVPRIAPHSPTLARWAIGCLALILPDALWSSLQHRPNAYNPGQGLVLTALDVMAFGGVFVALICGALILFKDARHSSN